MYIVTKTFLDKYDRVKIYNIGDAFVSDEPVRIENLLDRGFIKPAPAEEKPKTKDNTKRKGAAG